MSTISRSDAPPPRLSQHGTREPARQLQPSASTASDALGRREAAPQDRADANSIATRSALPLLSREQRDAPSDRFESPLSSFRSVSSALNTAPGGSTGVSSRSSAASLSLSGRDVVLDMDRLVAAGPPAVDVPARSARERIGAKLDALEFNTPAGPAREAQQSLEATYVDWVACVLDAREKAFGDRRYAVDANRSVKIREALLPAVYDGVRQFLSSSARSPLANAVATAVGPRFSGTDATGARINQGELNNSYDPAVIGGAVGGASALAIDSTLLSAMDRRAKLSNLPQIKPVNLKALVPDPGPVQLRIVDGRKEYWEPLTDNSSPDVSPATPTLASLKEAAEQRRKTLSVVQDMLEGKSWGLLAQPAVTGAANVLRRLLMPTASLLQPMHVAGASVLASGTAGGATRFGLGLLKAPAFADVDNLVGGLQRVDLFSTRPPNPDLPAAGWSDIGKLPLRAGETLVEAGLLASHYMVGPWRGVNQRSVEEVRARVVDVAHAVFSNILAAVFSTATGPLMAQVMRNGAAAALPDESSQSPAYLLQQFGQSSTNDFVWQASRSALRSSAFDLAKSLEAWRSDRQQQLRQTALHAQASLPHLSRQAESVLSVVDATALQSTLHSLRTLQHAEGFEGTTLRRALDELRAYALLRGDDATADIGLLAQRVEVALGAWQQREAVLRWSDRPRLD